MKYVVFFYSLATLMTNGVKKKITDFLFLMHRLGYLK